MKYPDDDERRFERGFKATLIIAAILVTAFVVAAVIVAAHFLGKVW